MTVDGGGSCRLWEASNVGQRRRTRRAAAGRPAVPSCCTRSANTHARLKRPTRSSDLARHSARRCLAKGTEPRACASLRAERSTRPAGTHNARFSRAGAQIAPRLLRSTRTPRGGAQLANRGERRRDLTKCPSPARRVRTTPASTARRWPRVNSNRRRRSWHDPFTHAGWLQGARWGVHFALSVAIVGNRHSAHERG